MRFRPGDQHSHADALTELFGGRADVIHTYTRAQAIADGAWWRSRPNWPARRASRSRSA
ncbi:hypothetical protein SRB17_86940 [Streptomyces sp. RB17]|nr:hypothetical protein [Streptomyces sp. RB17]